MSQTIFGRIISGEIPADKLLENDDLIVIRDLNPQAPVHLLIIPKKPLIGISDSDSSDTILLGKLLEAARDMAKSVGLNENGYRIVINNGADAGQTVPHLHLHLLGGRDFRWPPG